MKWWTYHGHGHGGHVRHDGHGGHGRHDGHGGCGHNFNARVCIRYFCLPKLERTFFCLKNQKSFGIFFFKDLHQIILQNIESFKENT